MQGAIVFRSVEVIPGREAAMVQLTRDANAFYDKTKSDGRISDYTWYTSAQGDRGDYLVVRGEMEGLSALVNEPDFQSLTMRSSLVLRGFEWGFYITGDPVEMLEEYRQMAEQLP
ncbi:MAG TPA: hypothetical protein VD813_00495 [Pseudonocardia sp.]|nr:hypothetical protein [Pseudonocardia sp.]